MKQRKVTIFSGKTFTVPQGIQRIDSHSTHGWQVRYQGTKFFSDGSFSGVSSDGSGADASLAAATKELLRRIATLPAPVVLKRGPSAHKRSGLPPGISGPIVVARGDKNVRSAVLSVLLPRWGNTPQLRSVYIGTENTYTLAKYRAALAEAKALRAAAVELYESDATRARRRDAQTLRKELAAKAAGTGRPAG
ncbi:MAG: hypothetical protein JNJ89_08530 [Rubrivivax sp.]|nr:hypothetical protein [Rubrivivax sp.]